MHHRLLRRALVLSLGATLAFAGVAAADTVGADGDVLSPTVEKVVDLGAVAPGSVHAVDVGFVLTCANGSHVDAGQTVTATFAGGGEPEDGKIVSVTDGTVGPAPASWPADGAPCASPAQTFAGGTASVVTLRAPTKPGANFTYSLMFDRSISPGGADDSGALRSFTAIDIVLDVNTPPSLTLPALAGLGTVEGNASGGWIGPWLGLAATDAEDDPEPTATCAPIAGTLLPLGPTTVTCTASDTGGLTTTERFELTVTDTTAPTLGDVPADQAVTTGDPTGATISYPLPVSTDIVDADPAVACLPVSGTHVGPGTTTVTCTATDASGNTDGGTFDVTVTYVDPHVASATWGEPIAGSGATFLANRGRTIPIKVDLSVDGEARSTGEARLLVSPCGGGAGQSVPLSFGGGRWNATLDTGSLAGSCYTVEGVIDELEAGAFRLELRGADAARTNAGKR